MKAVRNAPTMMDVATRAGVSRVTASLVLNDHLQQGNVRVSAATRERILRIAAEMRYQPSAVARSLRRHRTDTISLYINGGWLAFENSFFAAIACGLERGCYRNRKDLLLPTKRNWTTPEEAYLTLANGKIDGLVLICLPDDPLVPLLANSHLAVVAAVDPQPMLPSVVSEDRAGGEWIARYLAEKGHRRTLCRISEIPHQAMTRRLQAFQQTASQWNMEVRIQTVSNDRGVGLDAELTEMLRLPPEERPTAVFCWNDREAYKLLWDTEKAGIRIPEDLAIVGYDDGMHTLDVPFAPARQLTTVRVNWEMVSAVAVDCLSRLLEGEELPPETALPCELLEGDTA